MSTAASCVCGPIHIGVFSLAAAALALAEEAAWTTTQVLLSIAGVASIPLGLAVLRTASPGRMPCGVCKVLGRNHDAHPARQTR